MPAVSHVFRRGAVYYWRRRIIGVPAGDAGVVVVSLGTKDQDVARRRGAALTHMSEQLFEEIRLAHLSPEAARAILTAAALEQSDLLARAATADRARSEPEPMSGARADRVVGAVYKLLAERGTSAQLDADSAAFLARCGLPAAEAFQVQATLDVLRRQGLVPAPEWKLRKLLAEHAPDVEPSAVVLAETAHAFYRGKAAACLDTDERWSDTTSDDVELLRAARRNRAAPAPSTAEPKRSTTAPPPAAPTVSADREPAAADLATKVSPTPVVVSAAQDPDIPTTITGVVAKLAATRRQLGNWDEKTAGQHISVARLLTRIVQHDDVARLRQCDFAKYRDVLLGLPKSYGRSSKDAQRSVAELLARGRALPPEKRGLIAPTINRHMTQLGNILKSAASYGLRTAETIDLSGLRAKEGERDRDQRPPMTLDDIRAILKGAPWHGCLSEAKRLESGQMVIHDSLYWAPLIAIYSLMRREEICGLMIVDVHFDVPVPYFNIVRNKYRRLKNPQSKRKIPIHPELLRLGLRAYIEAIAALGYDLLFPELLPASGKAVLGNQFHRDWLPLLTHTAPAAVEAGKVFHSIRHFGNQQLVESAVIPDWRQDIMGHKGTSEAEERYRDDVALRKKLRALKKIPNVTAQLQAYPILLCENVVKKIGRKPRPKKGAAGGYAPISGS